MQNKKDHSGIVENEIVIYQTEDGHTKIDVKLENETVWLTQAQLCELYQTSKSNISEHIKHIFEEEELDEKSVVRKFRTTAADGKSYNTTHYNLEGSGHFCLGPFSQSKSSLFREFYLPFGAESGILEMKNIWRCRMAISYNRLWKRLIDLDLSKTDMMHRANISTNVLARLGKGAPVSMESMEKICKVLNCNIGDVMEFVPDNEDGGKDV